MNDPPKKRRNKCLCMLNLWLVARPLNVLVADMEDMLKFYFVRVKTKFNILLSEINSTLGS